MKHYLGLFILFIAVNSFASVQKIVAIVNDDPITLTELEDRVKMVAFLSNIDLSTASKHKELRSVALNSLIDEQLLLQEAKHIGLKITDPDIDKGIGNIEAQNKMPKGYLTSVLKENNISVTSFRNKIKIDILKYRLLSEVFAPHVRINQEQFESVIFNQKIKDADVKVKILSSKDDSNKSYKKMLNLSKKLTTCNKLKEHTYRNTATLETIDTKFSKLDSQIQTLVKTLKNNHNSSVVKIGDSFKILMLCNKKIDHVTDEETMYLSNFLLNTKVSMKLRKYQHDLRKKAYIKIL